MKEVSQALQKQTQQGGYSEAGCSSYEGDEEVEAYRMAEAMRVRAEALEGEFWGDSNAATIGFLREAEIKHGRVSMLACIGYIVPEYFKWPGYLSPSTGLKFADVPHGLAAITKVPAVGWQQIVFFGLAMELFAMNQNAKDPPGKLSSRLVFGLTDISTSLNTYTWGPFGIPNAPSIEDPEKRKRSLNAEIANGRLAMFAIMAMMFQNGTVGTTGPEMWLPPAP